jgi:hypothetical protein
MADIFISYSKHDPEHTIALAADLEACGYSTWWDTSLLPGDEFPELIKRRIDEAKVVIVIWTKNSVNSKWVRSEAARGYSQSKLVTLHADSFNFDDIPMPFNTLHCEPVTNLEKIYAALEGRGLTPNSHMSQHAVGSYEQFLQRIDDVVEWDEQLVEPATPSFPSLAKRDEDLHADFFAGLNVCDINEYENNVVYRPIGRGRLPELYLRDARWSRRKKHISIVAALTCAVLIGVSLAYAYI